MILITVGIGFSESCWASFSCTPCLCRDDAKGGITANCSNQGLNKIPITIPDNVTSLLLSHNIFSQVEPGAVKRFRSLQHLDLSFNKITSLHRDSLVGVEMLKTLSFHGNNINLTPTTYPQDVFFHQKQLVMLDISKNDNSYSGSNYPDKTLMGLTSLQTLIVDGLLNATFGEGFASLTKLTHLNLSGRKGYCGIRHLSNNAFTNLSSLRLLNISSCKLNIIDRSTFSPLKSITILDVSDNEYLGFDRLGESFYGLRHSSIRVLNANHIVPTFAIAITLKAKHVQYLNGTGIKHMDFASDRIELIETEVLSILSSLETINVGGNRFTFGTYLLGFDRMVTLTELHAANQYGSHVPPIITDFPYPSKGIKFPKRIDDTNNISKHTGHLSSLNNITLDNSETNFISEDVKRNINWYSFPSTTEYFKLMDAQQKGYTYLKNVLDFHIKIPMPPILTYINVSNSRLAYEIPQIDLYHNKVKTLDFSKNLLTKWHGPVSPIDRLEFLDLSQNFCNFMSSNFLSKAYALRQLNISHNYLALSLQNDTVGKLFQNVTNLLVLSIAYNLAGNLPFSLFKQQHRLEYLDLSWNLITSWTVQISHMKNFSYLDMSNNRFVDLPITLRSQIDEIMKNRNGDFHLKISGNLFKCDCSSLDYFQWMLKKHVLVEDINTTQCQMDDGTYVTLKNLEDIVLNLHLRCHTILPIIGWSVAGIVVFFTIVIAGTIYRYRWKLRYMYYSTRRRYRGYQRLTGEEDNFTYDAFVSYADEDRDFVVQDMRNVLERIHGVRLCIHHRDFMVGEAITANILNAIQSSRKTIVILSPSFLKSSWCDYEVHMAKLESIHTGRDVLCVVWYIDVPDNKALTEDISFEIEHGTYLRYPNNGEDVESFWQNLKEAIRTVGDNT